MSILPEIPVGLAIDLFARVGVTVNEDPRGLALRSASGASYHLLPFEGFVSGSQLAAACRRFDIDQFDLFAGASPTQES